MAEARRLIPNALSAHNPIRGARQQNIWWGDDETGYCKLHAALIRPRHLLVMKIYDF